MKIEIVVDPARAAPPPTLSQRVGPAPVTAAPAAQNNANGNGAVRNGRGGGAGKRGGRGRKRGGERPPKTAADLDAEMEDYSTTQEAPAA
ncbi:hypothetical protein BOTBODRAFT_36850 [Botryobasidium botryosum FD-172 SS1]|uniref:Chromatin target of PRMT1 protein C-terminal domain-containing protein n=1 Tax=Botryobasidium botryosum (strain FD-172 SS1) TaxID=930990 RepID=A0A067M1Z5_BOTB1|nr:hypothetical protein BOTBODRAFT_36850 [Botryobasidium botryosum FD-172 SS1]